MSIIELHRAAMNIAEEADRLKKEGHKSEAIKLYVDAFERERDAAFGSLSSNAEQPTPAILLKSAAYLALDAGLIRECEKLICIALSYDIPDEIADELRNLYEDVNFHRHLKLNGITLSEDEIQISIAGDGVAYGMARDEDVNNRIQAIKQLSVRTLEMAKGRPFRRQGKISDEIQNLSQSYYSVPRAASFAMTIRFGRKDAQLHIENFASESSALVELLVQNIKLLDTQNLEELRRKIPNNQYLLNFISYAKELAPDGKDVKLVGVTYNQNGTIVEVPLKRSQTEYGNLIESVVAINLEEEQEQQIAPQKIELTGMLMAADASKEQVRIVVDKKNYDIIVPDGLSDMVKKYFGEIVTLTVLSQKGNKYDLINIK